MAEHPAESSLGGIILARHAETDDNREPIRAQGWRDTPLNDTGRAQAAALAERLRTSRFGSLWCSDLSRARETAEFVGRRIGLSPRADPRLREGNRGRWEGLLFPQIEREEPQLYAAWRRAGPDFRFPAGESLAEHRDRVMAALVEIHATGPLPALVVCHGGSMRVTLCARDPAGLDAFHDFQIPNTALIPL
jgi:probable phosphoglycerate mutase